MTEMCFSIELRRLLHVASAGSHMPAGKICVQVKHVISFFLFLFLKGTLNTCIGYYLVSVGEMHFCFARIHGKNLIMCPSNCQQDPSHDYDLCQTITTTKKQNAFQTIILLSTTTKSFHFLIKFIFCALSQHKKKKIRAIIALHVNMLVAA